MGGESDIEVRAVVEDRRCRSGEVVGEVSDPAVVGDSVKSEAVLGAAGGILPGLGLVVGVGPESVVPFDLEAAGVRDERIDEEALTAGDGASQKQRDDKQAEEYYFGWTAGGGKRRFVACSKL